MDNEAEQILARVDRLLNEKKLLPADAERIRRKVAEKQDYRKQLDSDLAAGKLEHSEHSRRILAMHGEYANLDRAVDDAMEFAKRKKKKHELLFFFLLLLVVAALGAAIYAQKYIHDHSDVDNIPQMIESLIK